ncbi:MAG TPA: LysR family transcriptional regulator [Chloroflexi bacterium]|nr:LysR family transcriptional regulator [Chloroflexota bacterium]
MSGLEIHTLRVFLEAAKTQSFSEAARSLKLSQPAVSMQIRALEDYLQVELFERSPQGICLTRAGQALVPMAQQIIDMVISAEERIRASTSEVVGELVIGCSATAGKYVLPHLVARFRRLYPDVHVTIPVVSRRTMMEGILSGEYDLGVTSMREPDYDVNYSDFLTDQLVLIAPVSHPWAHRDTISAREMLSEQFICREPESACRATVSAGLARLGIDMDQLQIVMQVGSAEALAMAVEHGIGVSFVSLLAALPRVALGRLAIIQVKRLVLRNPVELVTSRTRAATPAQAKFVEFVNQPQSRSLIQMLSEGHMA